MTLFFLTLCVFEIHAFPALTATSKAKRSKQDGSSKKKRSRYQLCIHRMLYRDTYHYLSTYPVWTRSKTRKAYFQIVGRTTPIPPALRIEAATVPGIVMTATPATRYLLVKYYTTTALTFPLGWSAQELEAHQGGSGCAAGG